MYICYYSFCFCDSVFPDARRRYLRQLMEVYMEGLKLSLTIVQVISSLFLILVVLFQSGKSRGLSAAIAGGGDTFMSKNKSKSFDTKLATATKYVAALFLVLTLVLNLI